MLTIVRAVEYGEKLSLMRAGVQFGNEIGMALEIGLDTGAQTNLIRTRVVPETYLRESRSPLGLKTVSGAELSGGTKEVAASLTFQGYSERGGQEPNWIEDAVFYEAQIHVDAIMGFPMAWKGREDILGDWYWLSREGDWRVNVNAHPVSLGDME